MTVTQKTRGGFTPPRVFLSRRLNETASGLTAVFQTRPSRMAEVAGALDVRLRDGANRLLLVGGRAVDGFQLRFGENMVLGSMTGKGMPEGQAETLAEYLRQHHRRMAAQEAATDREDAGAARARADAQWRIFKTAGGIALGLLWLTWVMMWVVGG